MRPAARRSPAGTDANDDSKSFRSHPTKEMNPMSFSSDLDTCLSNANFPTLGQVFSSLTEALQEVSELKDALEAAGIELTAATVADLITVAKTASLSAGTAAFLGRLIAILGTLTVSVYLGAVLTCAAKVAVALHLDDELAAAPDSDAKRTVVATANDVRRRRMPA
jgi:hypothetical protein